MDEINFDDVFNLDEELCCDQQQAALSKASSLAHQCMPALPLEAVAQPLLDPAAAGLQPQLQLQVLHPELVAASLPPISMMAMPLPAAAATSPRLQPPESPQQHQEIALPLKRKGGRPPLNLTPEERAQRRELQRVRCLHRCRCRSAAVSAVDRPAQS